LPLDLIADFQWPQANESAKTFQGHEFVEQLQRILGVARDELYDVQDKQMPEANKSPRPIDPAITAGAGTSYVVQSIGNHRPSTEGTGWEYEVTWEDWDEKDNTWEPEDNMAKAKEMVKQYWREIGGWPKEKRKMTWRKV